MSYQFDTDIAAEFGVDEAIVIAHLIFWINKNQANEKHFYDGRYWTYSSIEGFRRIFPFWSVGQIHRILRSLKEQGVIVQGNYNETTYDRTAWYAFSDSFLRNQKIHFLKSKNGSDENEKCTINTDKRININTDNKENIASGELFAPETIQQTEKVKRPRKTSEKLCLFENSRYYDYDEFIKEFQQPEFKAIDMVHYYHVVADWSSSKGAKRRDWISQTRNIIRSDMEKGKLHKVATEGDALSPEALKYLQDMAN